MIVVSLVLDPSDVLVPLILFPETISLITELFDDTTFNMVSAGFDWIIVFRVLST